MYIQKLRWNWLPPSFKRPCKNNWIENYEIKSEIDVEEIVPLSLRIRIFENYPFFFCMAPPLSKSMLRAWNRLYFKQLPCIILICMYHFLNSIRYTGADAEIYKGCHFFFYWQSGNLRARNKLREGSVRQRKQMVLVFLLKLK